MRYAQQYNEFSKTCVSLMTFSPRSEPGWGKSSLKSMYKPSTTETCNEHVKGLALVKVMQAID